MTSKLISLTLLALLSAQPLLGSTFDTDALLNPEREQTGPVGPDLNPALAGNATLLLRQASDALRAGAFEDARSLADLVTTSVPDAAEGWHLLGMALANLERFNGALAALERASELYERNAQPLVMAGDILALQGRQEASMDAYTRAVRKDPSDWRARESLALFLEEQGEIGPAIENLQAALDFAPRDRIFTTARLAQLHFNSGDVPRAIDTFATFQERNPESVWALAALARLHLANEDPDAATVVASTALSLQPQSPDLHRLLADAQIAGGALDAAGETLSAARTAFPENVDVLHDVAALDGARRNYADALRGYQAALPLAPDDPRLHRGTILAAHRLGQQRDAADSVDWLSTFSGRTANDMLLIGVVQEALDAPEAAISAYEEVLRAAPGNWLAANNLASLVTQSDPPRAVALAKSAQAAAPQVPALQNTLGWAQFHAGEYAAARDAFAALLDEDASQSRYRYRLGRSLIAMGETEAGRAEIAQALQEAPDADFAASARDILAE